MADLIKISDSTSTTSSVVAASSTAVKAAMDKANSAATAASNAQTTADSKLSSITAGTGISVSGSKVSLATVVTAGNAGPTANATLSYSGTFIIPYITYDAYGRVTGRTNRTMTMPAKPSTTSYPTVSIVTSNSAPSGGTWWCIGSYEYYSGSGANKEYYDAYLNETKAGGSTFHNRWNSGTIACVRIA